MIRNIIFDFGAVLADWNPMYYYEPYFGSKEKAQWFLDNICTYKWNTQCDAGRTTAEVTAEKIAEFPEWEKEIRMYFDNWIDMMNGEIPGMYEILCDLKEKGYHLYGLTNWSRETFPLIRNVYRVFSPLEGIVVSGEEMIKKPDLRLFQILLDRYGLDPSECLFIDDNPANTDAGENVGIKGLVFESPEKLKEDLARVLPR